MLIFAISEFVNYLLSRTWSPLSSPRKRTFQKGPIQCAKQQTRIPCQHEHKPRLAKIHQL